MDVKDIRDLIKIKVYKFLLYSIFVLILFCVDRFSKIYVIDLTEKTDTVLIYLTPFLNSYLIWNSGIAFGLFSLSSEITYNLFTLLIMFINLVILYLAFKITDIRKFFFLLILGGSLGNLFDRLYYGSVPDFIDFHLGNFHWFIFNIADIFISIGVICLILVELFYKKRNDE
tara:strand:+ start:1079 stop:1594 length:516 start_codon:yes stop_codon:yes gene_type:complete